MSKSSDIARLQQILEYISDIEKIIKLKRRESLFPAYYFIYTDLSEAVSS